MWHSQYPILKEANQQMVEALALAPLQVLRPVCYTYLPL